VGEENVEVVWAKKTWRWVAEDNVDVGEETWRWCGEGKYRGMFLTIIV
jgi:hypothetical protein